MLRSKRIQPIEQHLSNKADDVARSAAKMQKNLKNNEDQLVQLERYRAEYQETYLRNAAQGIGGVQLRDFQQFLAKLDNAVAEQKMRIEQLTQEYQYTRQHWLKQRNHAKAVGNLVDRYKEQELKQANKKEQSLNDEFSMRFAGRIQHD